MKRVMAYLLTASLGAVFYCALWLGYEWAMNLLAFVAWFCAMVATVVLLLAKEAEKRLVSVDRLVHPWVSGAFDFVAVLALAACGQFLYATLWTYTSIVIRGVRAYEDEHKGVQA